MKRFKSWTSRPRSSWLPLSIALLLIATMRAIHAEPCPPPFDIQLEQVDPSPLAHWTCQEKWIWARNLTGEVADFDRLYDPTASAEALAGSAFWRQVSERFLLDVLGQPKLANALPARGLRIVGARINSALELSGLQFDHSLSLEKTRFDGAVSFVGAKIGGTISFDHSTFSKLLDMTGVEVAHDVFARFVMFNDGVLVTRSNVRGMLDVTGSSFANLFHLEGASIGSNLILSDGAVFRGDVYAIFLRVGGVLQTNHSTFEQGLYLEGAEIAENLLLRFEARFGGQVNLSRANVHGALDTSDGIFEGDVYLVDARVGSLGLAGASISRQFNIARTVVEHALYVGPSEKHAMRWGPEAHLILAETSVGAIDDWFTKDSEEHIVDSWPGPGGLHLNGFVYSHLGFFGTGRPSSWYIAWLEREPRFSPQPYQQMARAYRETGDYRTANDLLYAGRERERSELLRAVVTDVCRAIETKSISIWSVVQNSLGYLGLTILKWTIGYGLGTGYFRALLWIAGFTVTGALVLWTSGPLAKVRGTGWAIAASLDEILPVVELNIEYTNFINQQLDGWRLAYFYLHRIVAYVLGSFVIAGVAGLTQGA